jgi:hypothetical protein
LATGSYGQKQAKFKCFLTGETDMSKMQCHHLESWSRSETGRYDVKNGILVRTDIHKKFHAQFGTDVGKADFEQFLDRTRHTWGHV